MEPNICLIDISNPNITDKTFLVIGKIKLVLVDLPMVPDQMVLSHLIIVTYS